MQYILCVCMQSYTIIAAATFIKQSYEIGKYDLLYLGYIDNYQDYLFHVISNVEQAHEKMSSVKKIVITRFTFELEIKEFNLLAYPIFLIKWVFFRIWILVIPMPLDIKIHCFHTLLHLKAWMRTFDGKKEWQHFQGLLYQVEYGLLLVLVIILHKETREQKLNWHIVCKLKLENSDKIPFRQPVVHRYSQLNLRFQSQQLQSKTKALD